MRLRLGVCLRVWKAKKRLERGVKFSLACAETARIHALFGTFSFVYLLIDFSTLLTFQLCRDQ